MNHDLKTTEMGDATSTEDNKMMASFRIDRELWAKFGKLAKSERLTATDILTDYIQRCTDNEKSQYAVRMDTYEADKLNDTVIMMVNTAIEASLQSSVQVMIESALAPITEQAEEVRISTQSQLQAMRNEIEKALSDRILSIEQREKIAEVKTIEEQVNTPLIEISTISKEKAIENTVKSLDPDRKSIKKEIKRWLEPLKDEKFKEIIQAGICDKCSNQEIVTKLFEAGYGKDNNTNPYPANLASAMKTALSIEAGNHTSI
jgi:predicted nucleotide-binding protein (sugar kinase/HSP70/actin superfamily)